MRTRIGPIAPQSWAAKGTLGGDSGGESRGRALEGDLEAIPDHLVGIATLGSDGLAYDEFLAAVGTLHPGVVVFPELGAALDVGEQERHRAGGAVRHGQAPLGPRPGQR